MKKIILFLPLLFFACSVSRETTTTETETIKTISAKVPEIKGVLELPLVADTVIPQTITDTLAKIAPVFESEKEILTPQKDGSVTKSTVKIKSQFKKDQQGKPYLDTNFETKQPDVKAIETTTEKSREVKQKFSIDTLKPLIRIITVITILIIVMFLFKDKVFKR